MDGHATLNLDGGRYLSGDVNKFVTVTDPNASALLSRTTYTFATAQVGLEFGSQRWFTFYLRGGPDVRDEHPVRNGSDGHGTGQNSVRT